MAVERMRSCDNIGDLAKELGVGRRCLYKWQAKLDHLEAGEEAPRAIGRIHRKRGQYDWNTYALVGVIELARGKGKNPEVPRWLKEEYFGAIQELAKLGAVEVRRANNAEDLRAILCILAIAKNARTHARFLLEYSDEELIDLEQQAQG